MSHPSEHPDRRSTGIWSRSYALALTANFLAFFIVTSLAALAFVAYLIREWGRSSLLSLWGLALICGGALGNLVDRVRYGEVVDFIDWHWRGYHWPTFNIADGAITVGAILLLLSLLRSPAEAGPPGV